MSVLQSDKPVLHTATQTQLVILFNLYSGNSIRLCNPLTRAFLFYLPAVSRDKRAAVRLFWYF